MLDFKNNNDFILLFEKRLSEFTGSPYVVLTDSCTSSIFLSLYLEEAKNIKLPKHTYISVLQAAKRAGKKFELIDYNWEESYNIIGTNIYDCAVGFKENMYKARTIQCLSFQQKKCLNIGKAGAILLDDYDKYLMLKRLIWDSRDSSKTLVNDDHSKLSLDAFHCYMTPDDAAKGVLLLNQLSINIIENNLKSYKDYLDLSSILKI